MPSKIARLLVVSHVTHYAWDGRLYAYGPYAREIEIWADLFPELVIAAPCRTEQPPGTATAFTRSNVSIEAQPETGGDTWTAKLRQLLLLPAVAWSLARSLARADAVHVRCPGTLGALGLVLAPLFCRYRVAKYAGQWPEFPGEGWASRLQKRLLRSRWWSAPVTVYGQWPNQPAHIVPFFTSVMTSAQVDRARRAARLRRFDEPTLRILYVGALGAWKNVDAVIRAVANLRAEGVPVTCDLVGDGPARADLERLGAVLELGDTVQFVGGIDPEQVFDYYERSHVLVLASNSEGWPKAIAEAMSFGLICIGSNRGLVPQMLGDGRGFVVPPTDVDALTGTLLTVARSSDRLPALRARAAEWGQRYSLEDLRAALADLLTARWGVAIVGTAVAATAKPAAVCR